MSSLVFVVSALLEYSVVLLFGGQGPERRKEWEPERPTSRLRGSASESKRGPTAQLRRRVRHSNAISAVGVAGNIDIEAPTSVQCKLNNWFANIHTSRKVDLIAFCVFLASYAVFILIYWSILSNNSSCVAESCKDSQ